MENTVSDEQLLASLKRVERYAVLLDSCFRVPYTKIRFGLDSIIGLVPVVGETIGFILSMYLIGEAYKLKLPVSLKMKMLRNAALDWVIGIIPVFGDIADVAFKANVRNRDILVDYVNTEYERRHSTPEEDKKNASKNIFFLILVVVMLVLSVVSITYLVK